MSFLINPYALNAGGLGVGVPAVPGVTPIGQIQSPTSTGNQSYSIGFQPKLVMFFCNERGDGSTGADMVQMVGAASGSAARWVFGTHHDDARTNLVPVVFQWDNHCILVPLDASATTSISADFVSFNADGFTLNWDAVQATPFTVFYIAFGGADLASAKVGTFNTGTVTGNLAVTGVGFQPNLMMFACNRASTVNGNETTDAQNNMGFGVAKSAAAQWATSINGDRASDPINAFSFLRDGRCYARVDTNAPSFTHTAAFVSHDADGFTVNRVVNNSISIRVGYIALSLSSSFAVGVESQKTSTGDKATTGLGFRPGFLMLCGNGDTNAADSAVANGIATFIGAAVAGAEFAIAGSTSDNTADSECKSSSTASKILRTITGITPTVVAEANVNAETDGFSLNYTTADATARQFGYLAISRGIS